MDSEFMEFELEKVKLDVDTILSSVLNSLSTGKTGRLMHKMIKEILQDLLEFVKSRECLDYYERYMELERQSMLTGWNAKTKLVSEIKAWTDAKIAEIAES